MAIKKIKITIKSLKESFKEFKKFAHDFDRGITKQYTPEISFESFETYKKILTEKRLELLSIIRSKKPKNIRDLADITQRDFKNVYNDVKALEIAGLLRLKKSNFGHIPIVLYDELDIDIKIPLEIISK